MPIRLYDYGLDYVDPTNTGNFGSLNAYGTSGNSSGAGFWGYYGVGNAGINGYDSLNGGWEFYSYNINISPSNGENFLYDPNNSYGLGAGALAIGGTLYQNYYSDAKYKDNVTPIANALDRVNAIRGVEFDWNNLAN